jgi:hypothetical protein
MNSAYFKLVEKRVFRALGVVCLLLVSGCATLHEQSLSDMQGGRGRLIQVEKSGYGYLMITLPELTTAAELRAQCSGQVTGVETVVTSRNWLGVVQYFTAKSTAYCQ